MNRKNSLLLAFTIAALMVFAPHRASAACGSLPNVFVNGVSTVDASTTNANNNFLVACAKNVDNTQIGAAGIYASQIIPTNAAQATFGSAQTYTFSNGLAVTGAITATTSISAGNATAAALTAGDVGASRSTTTGAVAIGGSSSASTLDYGVTTASTLTNNTNFNDTGWISAGSATAGVLVAGDLASSRSTSTGALKLGGSGSGAALDYGITTAGVLTANTRLNDAGALSAGSATQATLTAGDVGASRSTTTGAVTIGGSGTAATIDWNVSNSARMTINQPTTMSSTLNVSSFINVGGNPAVSGLVAGDGQFARSTSTGAVVVGGTAIAGCIDNNIQYAGNTLTIGTASTAIAGCTVPTTVAINYGTGGLTGCQNSTVCSSIPVVYTAASGQTALVHGVLVSCATSAAASCTVTLSGGRSPYSSGSFGCGGAATSGAGPIGVLVSIDSTHVALTWNDNAAHTGTMTAICFGT